MKPAPFDYHRATSVSDALQALRSAGDEARVLAGGQSLIPMLNFRLARPTTLVDLGGVEELRYISTSEEALRIGAMTSQTDVLGSREVQQRWPLIAQAIGHIGHTVIRNAGTVGGSIAHADPAAELPVACVALGARLHLRSTHGERIVEARDFFEWYFTTAIAEGEILVEVEIPEQPAGTGSAFTEFARRVGDFALGGCAATVTMVSGECSAAQVVLLGAGSTPIPLDDVSERLVGTAVDEAAIAASVADLADHCDPADDHRAPRDYHLSLLDHLTRRALHDAAASADDGG